MGPELRREILMMPNQSQTGTYSQSHSQMSMLGANVSNDFKDGQTNVVQNLQVNLSPTSHNNTKQSVKATKQNETSLNYSLPGYQGSRQPTDNTITTAVEKQQKASHSFDASSNMPRGSSQQQQQPPQMGGGRAPIHDGQQMNPHF